MSEGVAGMNEAAELRDAVETIRQLVFASWELEALHIIEQRLGLVPHD